MPVRAERATQFDWYTLYILTTGEHASADVVQSLRGVYVIAWWSSGAACAHAWLHTAPNTTHTDMPHIYM